MVYREPQEKAFRRLRRSVLLRILFRSFKQKFSDSKEMETLFTVEKGELQWRCDERNMFLSLELSGVKRFEVLEKETRTVWLALRLKSLVVCRASIDAERHCLV